MRVRYITVSILHLFLLFDNFLLIKTKSSKHLNIVCEIVCTALIGLIDRNICIYFHGHDADGDDDDNDECDDDDDDRLLI